MTNLPKPVADAISKCLRSAWISYHPETLDVLTHRAALEAAIESYANDKARDTLKNLREWITSNLLSDFYVQIGAVDVREHIDNLLADPK